MDPPAAAGGRSLQDVDRGPVVPDEIQVHRREVIQPMAQIAGQSDGLQEHLRQNHGGAGVDVYPALQPGHLSGQNAEIQERRRSGAGGVEPRMHVNDVRADRDVNRHRDVQAGSGRQNAVRSAGEARTQDVGADRAAQALDLGGRCRDRPVEDRSGFGGHAEGAVVEGRADLFRGPAGHGHLQIVDDSGPVQGDSADDPALHQVDHDRAEARLDNVGAHAQDHRASSAVRGHDRGDDRPEVRRRQNLRQALQKRAERAARGPHAGELGHPQFAGPVGQRVGPDPPEIDRSDVRLHFSCAPAGAHGF